MLCCEASGKASTFDEMFRTIRFIMPWYLDDDMGEYRGPLIYMNWQPPVRKDDLGEQTLKT